MQRLPQGRRDARPGSPRAGGTEPPQDPPQPPASPAPARVPWVLQSCTPSRMTHIPGAPSAVKSCVGIN